MFVTTLDIVIDGVAYKAGDEVDTRKTDPGCLESCFRLGKIVKAEPPKKKAKADEGDK